MKTLYGSRRNGMSPKIKLLLVDDHEIALEALKLYFSIRSNFDVTAIAADRLDAIQNAKTKAPDVVMMNMRMPQVDAAAATKRLLERLPKTKVIGFSGLEDRKVILSMIRAGARGYLLKGCTSRELFRAVEAVNSGVAFFSAPISKMIEDDYLQNFSTPQQNGTCELKECERKILTMIADGLSNKEIANTLTMSVRTIEKYRETLMAKLQIKSIAGLTKFAIRNGMARLD
jgi:DNA-binding NarL/FixJ family response regulator